MAASAAASSSSAMLPVSSSAAPISSGNARGPLDAPGILSSLPCTQDVPGWGTTVLVYEGPGNMKPVTLTRGGDIQNRFGVFRHEDIVGRAYGRRVRSRGKTDGFMYVLRMTPELWTLSLPHRTQILYAADISMVVMRLGLRPGSVVVESGTGSGSLTHSLARAVAPSGHVFTFEFNEDRVQKARAEFKAHGVGDVVTVTHRDAVANGFQPEVVIGTADGVFLDLPNPWAALQHAKNCLKPCGVLCNFSPCIEQVQRVCVELVNLGFDDIRTFETLTRSYEVVDAYMGKTEGKGGLDLYAPGSATGLDTPTAAAAGAGGAGAGSCGGAGAAASAPSAAVKVQTWKPGKRTEGNANSSNGNDSKRRKGEASAAGSGAAVSVAVTAPAAVPAAASAAGPAVVADADDAAAAAGADDDLMAGEGAGGNAVDDADGDDVEQAESGAGAGASSLSSSSSAAAAGAGCGTEEAILLPEESDLGAPASSPMAAAASSAAAGTSAPSMTRPMAWPTSRVTSALPYIVRPSSRIRGHTGYLTFATLYCRK